ncbi:mannosyl-glycoprotein endo-beta-N-acetylglucosamidase [Bacillus sp. AFS073361]|uniref:N-acetylglucosaminidase n=1 Tax=Bacillus sp. AFS073361 TaxID=2033511 RepID=UPI000BF7BEE0|nr:GW dipeptide domain-containing protein [Bacillus sp. AFS073361]PFP24263.1 mannosyl-glycoprotein endo-beta-N-acetylglucosamidase [Bacillus sp. AFS073361]
MKYISRLLVLVLIFCLIGPYYTSAESNLVNIEDLSTPNPEQSNAENADLNKVDETLTDTNDVENNTEEATLDESSETQETELEKKQEEKSVIKEGSITSNSNEINSFVDDSTHSDGVNVEVNSKEGNEVIITDENLDNSNLPNTIDISNTFVMENIVESQTSRLGHIKSGSVVIYRILGDDSTSFTAGSTYTNKVYYIKKQAKVNDETYYLLSNNPSSEYGVVGWVKALDLSTQLHVGVDKLPKIFAIKGMGSSFSKAWGGKKDYINEDLSVYQDREFKVNLTEKVGNIVWYRGELDGKTVWIQSSNVTLIEESQTSRLGHIRSGSVIIYRNIGDDSTSFTAGFPYTNKVYYIKKQAKVNDETYYLLSNNPSSEYGVVGWAKALDLSTQPHFGVDKLPKIFAIKGTGSAFSKAWGGKKDYINEDLSVYQDREFKVNLTEKVGNIVWYRGELDGKTVWIQSNNVTVIVESQTSRLGHIRSGSVKIYRNIGEDSTSFTAGSIYTNAVYYIKKQAIVNGQTFYLLSKQPSSTSGIVGWAKATDLTTNPHIGIDHQAKTFYIKGTGSAFSKAWGGKKDLIYDELSKYETKVFQVNLTEKVGNIIWYRGELDGKSVWVHGSYLLKPKDIISKYTSYVVGLSTLVQIQMAANPQTDKRYKLWIRQDAFKKDSIRNDTGTITGDSWNLRRGPGNNYIQGGKVKNGEVLTIYSSIKGEDGYIWYNVKYTSGWVTPDENDLKYYLNYSNFTGNFKDSLQFLKLSQSANINVVEVNNKILKNKGILSGKAKAFVDGSKQYGLNEIYLISHALLETGNGSSPLANGIEVGKDKNGNLVLVTSSNRSSLKDIKKTYNMFGINAKDTCPNECGAKYAYEAGWFSPEKAIVGGAAFIGKGYVNNGQDTLYKMRWNPAFAAVNMYASHQYATDIGWAFKQTSKMYELYSLLDEYILVLDIPKYR